MNRLLTAVLSVSLILSGCAHRYSGPGPDFSLKGADAKKEYEKFKFDESWLKQHPRVVHMGPESQQYFRETLDPVIEKVSPLAMEKYKKSEWILLANLFVYLGLFGWAGLNYLRDKSATTETALILGSSVAYGIVMGTVITPSVTRPATEQYNEDLKKKFEPSLAFRASF